MLNISTQTTSDDSEVVNVVERSQDFWALHSDFAIEDIRLKSLFSEQTNIIEWDLESAAKAIRAVLFLRISITRDGKPGIGTQALRWLLYCDPSRLQHTDYPSSTREAASW